MTATSESGHRKAATTATSTTPRQTGNSKPATPRQAEETVPSVRVTRATSCLVLDVRLPGLSGLDLQAELADAGLPIPIIFITGHGDIPMSVRAMKAGAIDFLTKPFRDQDLLDAVTRALERDRTRRNDEKEILDFGSGLGV
jgi:FixJ family two-component response regulator